MGAIVAVYDTEDKLLLVQHQLYNRKSWGFPAVFMKRNEEPHVAAGRALLDELRITCEFSEHSAVAHYRQPWAQHIDILFRVTLAEDAASSIAINRRRLRAFRWIDPNPNLVTRLTPEASVALNVLAGERPSGGGLTWPKSAI